MYTPRAFAETDLAELDRLVVRDAFVTVVSTHEGAPIASHLPLLYARAGRQVRFRGHWARPNPQWQDIEGQQVLLIVHGPHAYISPGWYVDAERQVPTWNYAVAHIYGRARVFHDEELLADLVSELALKNETGLGSRWRFDRAAEHTRRDLRSIVGFSLDADRIELKFKFNQNHPAANVQGAAAALQRLGSEQGLEVAAEMRKRLDARLAAPADPEDHR